MSFKMSKSLKKSKKSSNSFKVSEPINKAEKAAIIMDDPSWGFYHKTPKDDIRGAKHVQRLAVEANSTAQIWRLDLRGVKITKPYVRFAALVGHWRALMDRSKASLRVEVRDLAYTDEEAQISFFADGPLGEDWGFCTSFGGWVASSDLENITFKVMIKDLDLANAEVGCFEMFWQLQLSERTLQYNAPEKIIFSRIKRDNRELWRKGVSRMLKTIEDDDNERESGTMSVITHRSGSSAFSGANAILDQGLKLSEETRVEKVDDKLVYSGLTNSFSSLSLK